jgi:hypothetical protein
VYMYTPFGVSAPYTRHASLRIQPYSTGIVERPCYSVGEREVEPDLNLSFWAISISTPTRGWGFWEAGVVGEAGSMRGSGRSRSNFPVGGEVIGERGGKGVKTRTSSVGIEGTS